MLFRSANEILSTLLHREYHLPGESVEIRALDAVVQRCLAKDPRDRYGSSAEVAKELVPTLVRCSGFEARSPVTPRQQNDGITLKASRPDSHRSQ